MAAAGAALLLASLAHMGLAADSSYSYEQGALGQQQQVGTSKWPFP